MELRGRARFRASSGVAGACVACVACGLACLSAGLAASSSPAALTLIQRSNGLQVPSKEEGHTEYEVGDVNGDGHLDLVSVGDHGSPFFNSDQHGIMTWLGDGTGNWTVHQVGNFGYGGVALGDLDRDGRLDAAWGVHHDYGSGGLGDALIGAALGDGTGMAWTPWGAGLATTGESWGMFATDLADFDLDGRLDLVSQSFGGSNGIRIYRNRGDGSWESGLVLSGQSVWYTIETGDVNADGRPDFVCTRSGGTVWLGDGEFGFAVRDTGIAAGTVRAVDVGDLDGDGTDDVLMGVGSSGVRAYRWDRDTGSWLDASGGLPTTGSYDLVQFGDLNGDGLLDAVVYSDPTGRIYLGDGQGHWTADASWNMPAPGTASALRVDGDVDHDGRDDIVIVATQSGFPFYRNQLRVYSPWQAPPALATRIQKPIGGETWVAGSVREVRWATAVPPGEGTARVSILLSRNGEEGPWVPLAEDLPDAGRYEWIVTPGSSERCRIEVVARTEHGMTSARSPEDFVIAGGDPAELGDGEEAGDPLDGPSVSSVGHLRVEPNPVGEEGATLWWASATPIGHGDGATLTVFDAAGRTVQRQMLPSIEGGSFYWKAPPDWPDGVYFVELAGSRRLATRFVLAR